MTFRFLDDSQDKLLTKLTSFPSSDANGNEDEMFKMSLACSTPGFTLKPQDYPHLKNTGVQIDHITDDKFKLLLENNREGGPSTSMGNRHVQRGERKIV